MKNKIITISREFGSGGRTVGKEVAKKLGIPCYDQEIIEKIAQESGLTKDFVAEKGEYTARGGVFRLSHLLCYGSQVPQGEYPWSISA